MWFYLLVLALIIYMALRFFFFTGLLGGNAILQTYFGLNRSSYTIFHDLCLEHTSGKMIRIDQLIVSNYGVFVIVTHKYRGVVEGSENSAYWTIRLFKKTKKTANLLKQAKIQVKLIKETLENSQLKVIPMVVLSGFFSLKIKTDAHVIHVSRLKTAVGSFNQVVLDDISKQQIVRKLQRLQSDNKEDIIRIYSVEDAIMQRRSLIKSNICPKCGYLLITKQNNNKKYKCCSQYPKCKFKTAL